MLPFEVATSGQTPLPGNWTGLLACGWPALLRPVNLWSGHPERTNLWEGNQFHEGIESTLISSSSSCVRPS